MNDLISRQAAIDAIYHHLPSVSRTRARTMLHEVPSAQPEKRMETHACDLIDRQAAIDAADRADYTGLAIEDVKKVTDEVVKELKRLPSAQPEQKKGRWIDKKCSRCGCGSMLGLCIENFCPNCGADMRGEQDET